MAGDKIHGNLNSLSQRIKLKLQRQYIFVCIYVACDIVEDTKVVECREDEDLMTGLFSPTSRLNRKSTCFLFRLAVSFLFASRLVWLKEHK